MKSIQVAHFSHKDQGIETAVVHDWTKNRYRLMIREFDQNGIYTSEWRCTAEFHYQAGDAAGLVEARNWATAEAAVSTDIQRRAIADAMIQDPPGLGELHEHFVNKQ